MHATCMTSYVHIQANRVISLNPCSKKTASVRLYASLVLPAYTFPALCQYAALAYPLRR